MNNNTFEQLNQSSFFEGLSAHYDRFGHRHDLLRSQLLSDLKPYGQGAGGSVSTINFKAQRGISLTGYLSRFAAIAAVLVLAFGLAVLNIGNSSTVSVAQADSNILQKVTNFNNVHFKMTVMDSSMEMWWQRPNSYRMQFNDGTVIVNNPENYSCLNGASKEVSVKPGLTASGPEMFMLAELGEVFPFESSPTQALVKTSDIISNTKLVFKGEECYKVRTRNDLSGDLLEYIIDCDQPMIYEISRIRQGRVISHVEVIEIDSAMPESLFRLN
ncbi:MAG: hypothetical protein JW745_06855 [Sedimentisphaerales bacterium]|nr:hypothetical protein [Sedimentisphaerales bacterium]MBN2841825.1 hypothetical protein [Sedimentisphaerales bacterium]